jgi:hypothetical protein
MQPTCRPGQCTLGSAQPVSSPDLSGCHSCSAWDSAEPVRRARRVLMSARAPRLTRGVLGPRAGQAGDLVAVRSRRSPSRPPSVWMAGRSGEEQVRILWMVAEPGAVMIRITPCLGRLRLCGPRRGFTDGRRQSRNAARQQVSSSGGAIWGRGGTSRKGAGYRVRVATSGVGYKHPGIAVNAEGIVMLEPQAE